MCSSTATKELVVPAFGPDSMSRRTPKQAAWAYWLVNQHEERILGYRRALVRYLHGRPPDVAVEP
jgi:hypothetical protein